MTDRQLSQSEEQLLKLIGPRCETPDYNDIPDLKPDERCIVCEMWDAVDAYVAEALATYDNRLYTALEAAIPTEWTTPRRRTEPSDRQLGYNDARAEFRTALNKVFNRNGEADV